MPWGRYPDRVASFNKWARDRVNKAEINDKATSFRKKKGRRRRRRKKKHGSMD